MSSKKLKAHEEMLDNSEEDDLEGEEFEPIGFSQVKVCKDNDANKLLKKGWVMLEWELKDGNATMLVAKPKYAKPKTKVVSRFEVR